MHASKSAGIKRISARRNLRDRKLTAGGESHFLDLPIIMIANWCAASLCSCTVRDAVRLRFNSGGGACEVNFDLFISLPACFTS